MAWKVSGRDSRRTRRPSIQIDQRSQVPSAPEVRRLLCVLSAGRVCAEIGTGLGEGAAAIAETAVSLVTVEIDRERAAIAETRLAGYPHARVVAGDWQDVLTEYGPFDFVFLDGPAWPRRPSQLDHVIDLLSNGGLLLVDDLRPSRVGEDAARDMLLTHPRLVASELLISASFSGRHRRASSRGNVCTGTWRTSCRSSCNRREPRRRHTPPALV